MHRFTLTPRRGHTVPTLPAAPSVALVLAIAVTGCLGSSRTPARAGGTSTLLISNATIIDPSAAQPKSRGDVLVVGERIVAVGADIPRPAGATVLDAQGKFVLPGLWDMHAHLAALTPIGRIPEDYVGHGILAVRDMGSLPDSIFPLRDRIRRGERIGPELVVAGPTLNGEAAADFHRKVTTDAEARAAVREVHAMGADFIKIHRATTREAFLAIADETRRLGLRFAGHVPLVMRWTDASAAGMHSIEHIQTLYENEEPNPARVAATFPQVTQRLEGAYGDSIFSVLARNGTWFDPNLIGYERTIESVPPAIATLRRSAYARMKVVAAHAARAGVPLLAGTDVRDAHGEALLTELERLVEIGLTPQQALAAATTSAAMAAGRPALARIAPGNIASLLVLDADPLLDVQHVRRLHGAVLRGQWLSSRELIALRAPPTPPAR